MSIPFPEGVFVHLAVTISSADGTAVYVDGTQVFQSFSIPPNPLQNDAEVQIANGPLGGFIGILDEVQFYNRVLSADEVAALVPMQ